MIEKGWTVPNWPKEYGAGLDKEQYVILLQEMAAINTSPLIGMGVVMIGPTLLEYGNEEQKLRHLPKIAHGNALVPRIQRTRAGSDLAGLQTRAVTMASFSP